MKIRQSQCGCVVLFGGLNLTACHTTTTIPRSKSPFGAVTDWVDDYRTRKSGYGPPYYSEYGGDLPRECDRMGADLMCVSEAFFGAMLLRTRSAAWFCVMERAI